MVASFSGVLAVDIRGFLWMAGLRPVQAALRMENFVTPFIRGGLLALLVSGIWLVPFKERLRAMGRDAPFLAFTAPWFRQQLLLRFPASQLCWWTAVIVGFVSAGSH